MEKKLNIPQKLLHIRKEVPYMQKDTKGYKYTYVSGANLLSTIVPKMNELGLLLIPKIDSYEIVNGSVACKMTMTWLDTESGETLDIPFACFGHQDDISKAFGSALTYSERYFLLKFFNIATDEDDPDSFQKKVATISENQVLEIEKIIVDKGINKDKFLEYCGVSSIDKILLKDHEVRLKALRSKK